MDIEYLLKAITCLCCNQNHLTILKYINMTIIFVNIQKQRGDLLQDIHKDAIGIFHHNSIHLNNYYQLKMGMSYIYLDLKQIMMKLLKQQKNRLSILALINFDKDVYLKHQKIIEIIQLLAMKNLSKFKEEDINKEQKIKYF
ncbi:unnamed protein product [Paramecium pentaurelia]|uniref:Uncharacterized protein n=1 Tax=Paramecium pentaurelia TaxID=43138 RepID=A0A8S1VG49_9CILI|nr:unnamed protein product [Paramecium pentaurelia]